MKADMPQSQTPSLPTVGELLPLLPCPFCGCKAVWFKTGRDIGIECQDGFDCPGRAQTNVYAPEHRQEVIAEWNRRVGSNGEDIRDQIDAAIAQDRAARAVPDTFEAWWYGHDGVRQRQVAYLGWPCTKELAESIWSAGALTVLQPSVASQLAQDFPPMGGLTECDMGDSDE